MKTRRRSEGTRGLRTHIELTFIVLLAVSLKVICNEKYLSDMLPSPKLDQEVRVDATVASVIPELENISPV